MNRQLELGRNPATNSVHRQLVVLPEYFVQGKNWVRVEHKGDVTPPSDGRKKACVGNNRRFLKQSSNHPKGVSPGLRPDAYARAPAGDRKRNRRTLSRDAAPQRDADGDTSSSSPLFGGT